MEFSEVCGGAAIHSRSVLIIKLPLDASGWCFVVYDSKLLLLMFLIHCKSKKKEKYFRYFRLFSFLYTFLKNDKLCSSIFEFMKVRESRPLQQHWLHGHAQHAKSSYIFYSSSENISLFSGFGGSLWEKLQIQHQILKFCLCVLGIFHRGGTIGGARFQLYFWVPCKTLL